MLDKKKPNILFIVIDSLRNDQCHGNNRTSITPNIDKMISNGSYFSQTISSADGTILALNSVLTGLFPFRTGTRAIKFSFQKNNFIQELINFGYSICGFGPSLTSFVPLSKYFENENSGYSAGPPAEPLSNNLGDKILELFNNIEQDKPWFYFLHIEELHSLREGSEPIGIDNFDDQKFGDSPYERIVSHIDHWIGKILDKINLENTIVVFTSDHGERIPYDNIRGVELEPKFDTSKKIGMKMLPKSTHKIGGKFLSKLRKPVGAAKLKNANKDLEPYQIRSRDNYFTPSLFDELLRVPLVFYGYNIPKKNIKQQARGVDIFPTLCDMIGLEIKKTIDGQSLLPLLHNLEIPELPTFIHTIPHERPTKLDCMGVRTSNYKFFCSVDSENSENHLYNLIMDPNENKNLINDEKEKVIEMNNILQEFLNNRERREESTNSDENKKISEELKKLGYL